MKRILALAVGDPKASQTIGQNPDLSGVRPYISGLISGLARLGHKLGADFEIDYVQSWYEDVESGHVFKEKLKNHDLIYAMSTTVMRAAGKNTNIDIVFPNCSEHAVEQFVQDKRATGYSAQRAQTAGDCFEFFFQTVPTLKKVFILHKDDNDPSDHAKDLVTKAAKNKGATPTVLTINSHLDLQQKLSSMPERDLRKPADIGIHVLPVDLFFGTTPEIIQLVQVRKNLPAFFPVTDWVQPTLPSALGGYGVPQYKCGQRTATHVDQILWRGQTGQNLPTVTDAISSDFECLVSSAAAEALNIPVAGIGGHPRVI
jgi:ABC-type uncharacterized transport system substrate-binding protein